VTLISSRTAVERPSNRSRIVTVTRLRALLNSAELWPVPVTQMKTKLDAAHHRWQQSILGISWKDKVTNEKVKEATALPKLEDIQSINQSTFVKRHMSRANRRRVKKKARPIVAGYRMLWQKVPSLKHV